MATTVLDIVQKVLSSMDSDEVNSIGDTIESEQIATLVREAYDDILDQYDLPDVKDIFQLEGLADTARPTVMKMPDSTFSITELRYDVRSAIADEPEFRVITYCEPPVFFDRSYNYKEDDTNIIKVTLANGAYYLARNDQRPHYWTSVDDKEVIFDAFEVGAGSTMHSERTMVLAQGKRELILDDTTPITLPEHLLGVLRNEVRSMAFDLYKDGTTPKVEQAAQRSRVRAQRTKRRIQLNQERDDRPDYGRKGSRQVIRRRT